MWECKGKKARILVSPPLTKFCPVEECPMEHWVESHMIGCEWELFITEGCLDCPLKKLKEDIINDIQRITGGNDDRNERKKQSEERRNC